MARKSFVSDLPDTVLHELNDRIRAAKYGDHDTNVEWLDDLGYNSSRSAMGRYALELKKLDGHQGTAGSLALHASIESTNSSVGALLKELGELEYKKHQILVKLQEITGK